MTALLLDGRPLAASIQEQIKQRVDSRLHQGKRPPSLAVILLGNDPASSIYVANKRRACAEVGFNSLAYDLEATVSEDKLLALIDKLNQSADVDGILVQLPLPKHLNEAAIIERIAIKKDVDGFHPYNLGRLAQGRPAIRPCTPYGIIQLLKHYQIELPGKHTVVVGASNIVGRPMALEFLQAKSTISICHRFTHHLDQHVRMADILIVATGVYNLIDPNWLHADQVIVDVGIHRRINGSLHGDIHFEQAKKQVAWITPVPGGVGPMTISALLQNTLLAMELKEDTRC